LSDMSHQWFYLAMSNRFLYTLVALAGELCVVTLAECHASVPQIDDTNATPQKRPEVVADEIP